LYLGAHFPHDVLFGWLIGAIVLWGFMKTEDRVADWVKSQTLSMQIGFGFVVSLLIILLGVISRSLIAGIPDPQAWQGFVSGARSLSQFFTLSGAFFGSIFGYALMRQYARFQTSGTLAVRVLRYLLGILGLVLIYVSLDNLFSLISPDETALGYALRYIRYSAVAFWTTFAAPWFFLKIKLAETEIR
jgi:uncharacterized Tic20 family protein